MFGGPNGSGKSTILNSIDSKFEIGYYINADEIEKQLKSAQSINLTDYGIHDFSLEKFEKAKLNHSLIKKARSDGYEIDLYCENNSIINPDKNSHSYEAAFLADILRNELLSLGKIFAYETVM